MYNIPVLILQTYGDFAVNSMAHSGSPSLLIQSELKKSPGRFGSSYSIAEKKGFKNTSGATKNYFTDSTVNSKMGLKWDMPPYESHQ